MNMQLIIETIEETICKRTLQVARDEEELKKEDSRIFREKQDIETLKGQLYDLRIIINHEANCG